jgi:hypothetical protein
VYDNPTLILGDPDYVKSLEALPTVMREQFLNGNWEVGTGLAFEALTETSHRVPGVTHIPTSWRPFGAFDWGFGHRWAFLLLAIKPDGSLVVVDSVMGRRQVPEEIAERVGALLRHRGLRFSDLTHTVAGSDTKIRDGARGNWGPSVAEQFAGHGWYLINADQNRIAGYQNLLTYLHRQRLAFCDTPTNAKGVDQMMSMVVDPDSPNDILKVDVNEATGEGGDDWVDALRYGCMSRPVAGAIPVQPVDRINRLVAKKDDRALGPAWRYDQPRPHYLVGAAPATREEIV